MNDDTMKDILHEYEQTLNKCKVCAYLETTTEYDTSHEIIFNLKKLGGPDCLETGACAPRACAPKEVVEGTTDLAKMHYVELDKVIKDIAQKDLDTEYIGKIVHWITEGTMWTLSVPGWLKEEDAAIMQVEFDKYFTCSNKWKLAQLEVLSNNLSWSCGVEGFRHPKHGNVEYINAGDTYASTIVYYDNTFHWTTWGDVASDGEGSEWCRECKEMYATEGEEDGLCPDCWYNKFE